MILSLVNVDEAVLEELVTVARADADADEVTPPLGEVAGWSPERIAWLRAYHRDRRPGLDGPAGEATWAVVVHGAVVGAVRLARLEGGAVETGIWLRRTVRRQGVGVAALAHVLVLASAAGATQLVARTTLANAGAQAVLRQLGFLLSEQDGEITAVLGPLPDG
ncbi:MAG: GNAT family N-acetyltransferase [Mycobacteriaceae bacterium]